MRKIIAIVLLTAIVLSTVMSMVTVASPATSYTWTFNAKGHWTKTQDAYLPELTLISLELKEPEDLFIDRNNVLYIADTGNKRIVKYDIDSGTTLGMVEFEGFKSPKGVYVTDDGNLYVADAKAESIFRFDANGSHIETFGRPTDRSYGNTPYNPARVAVDSKKNMFIIGEGVLNGIIHISSAGQFLGYFASNKVTLDLVQELQNFFFTDEQMDNLGSRIPLTITNIYVDEENIVYSTTMGRNADKVLAKHNTAGKNVFPDPEGASDLIDLYVDPSGIIYTASLTGEIYIYSPDGDFIHSFGGFYGEEDISGLFTDLGSIAVDRDGKIWAADSSTSYIQSFRSTEYAETIYSALSAFKLGRYSEAENLWKDVLQKNQMLRLAHEGLGKVYLYTERYEEAMHHLEIANNKYFYSQAFWEVRNIWLQDNLAWLITVMIVLIIASQFLKQMDKRRGTFDFVRDGVKKARGNALIDDLLFSLEFIKHPIDAFYDIKIGKRGSYKSASILMFLFFGAYLQSSFGRSFLFTPVAVEDIDFAAMIIGFIAIVGLFIITNYLITSIQDGAGTLGDVYKLTAYAVGPMTVGITLVTGLSYIMTFNEIFFAQFVNLAAPVWALVLLIVGLQEVHEYATREAIKSIILSLAFMLVIAIVLLIVIVMGEQVYDFFEVIIREVIRNVQA